MGERQNEKDRTLVLLGKTGNGKSSTGNAILGYPAFKQGRSFNSVTQECSMESVVNNGREVRVVDTPGLFDPEIPQEDVIREVKKCIDLAKDGLHGVLLVLRAYTRFSPEEAAVPLCLQAMFGPDILNYAVVLFTTVDSISMEEDLDFKESFKTGPKPLRELLYRCKNRAMLFNIKPKSRQEQQKQATELLWMVDRIVKENEGKPFSNQLFKKYQDYQKCANDEEREKICEEIDATVVNLVKMAFAVLFNFVRSVGTCIKSAATTVTSCTIS